MTATINTRSIGEYLDDPGGLTEVHPWVSRGTRGVWHSDRSCWQLLTHPGAPLRQFNASLLDGSGKICFSCGTRLMENSPHDPLSQGWGAALFLEHNVEQLLRGGKGRSVSALNDDLMLARNALAGFEETISDIEKQQVSRKLNTAYKLAEALEKRSVRQLKELRPELIKQASMELVEASVKDQGKIRERDVAVLGGEGAVASDGTVWSAFEAWKRHVMAGNGPAEAARAAIQSVSLGNLKHLSQLEFVPLNNEVKEGSTLDAARKQWLECARKAVGRLAAQWHEALVGGERKTEMVAVGLTNAADVVQPVGVATASLGAWTYVSEPRASKAIALVPEVVAEAIQSADFPWGVEVHQGGACGSQEQAATALVLWEPGQAECALSDLKIALAAARKL